MFGRIGIVFALLSFSATMIGATEFEDGKYCQGRTLTFEFSYGDPGEGYCIKMIMDIPRGVDVVSVSPANLCSENGQFTLILKFTEAGTKTVSLEFWLAEEGCAKLIRKIDSRSADFEICPEPPISGSIFIPGDWNWAHRDTECVKLHILNASDEDCQDGELDGENHVNLKMTKWTADGGECIPDSGRKSYWFPKKEELVGTYEVKATLTDNPEEGAAGGKKHPGPYDDPEKTIPQEVGSFIVKIENVMRVAGNLPGTGEWTSWIDEDGNSEGLPLPIYLGKLQQLSYSGSIHPPGRPLGFLYTKWTYRTEPEDAKARRKITGFLYTTASLIGDTGTFDDDWVEGPVQVSVGGGISYIVGLGVTFTLNWFKEESEGVAACAWSFNGTEGFGTSGPPSLGHNSIVNKSRNSPLATGDLYVLHDAWMDSRSRTISVRKDEKVEAEYDLGVFARTIGLRTYAKAMMDCWWIVGYIEPLYGK